MSEYFGTPKSICLIILTERVQPWIVCIQVDISNWFFVRRIYWPNLFQSVGRRIFGTRISKFISYFVHNPCTQSLCQFVIHVTHCISSFLIEVFNIFRSKRKKINGPWIIPTRSKISVRWILRWSFSKFVRCWSLWYIRKTKNYEYEWVSNPQKRSRLFRYKTLMVTTQ